MKQKAILTSLTTLALLAGSGAASASAPITQTFSLTPATSFLVTEAHAPTGVSATTYNGSVNYTQGLWAAGGVSSAILKLNLQDDTSSTLPTLIDLPREWAKLTAVTDGSKSFNGSTPSLTLPASQEVDIRTITGAVINQGLADLGVPTLPTSIANTAAAKATNLGFENARGNPPTAADYFNLDVSSLLNQSNSGSLNFSLAVDAKYADIAYSTNPLSDFRAIKGIFGPLIPNASIYMIEDYLFNHATLTVTYAPAAVPVPGAVWLFGSALAGFIGFRRKSV